MLQNMKIDLNKIPTPCYICDECALERNLRVLGSVQEKSACKIILALKGFAMFSMFPLIRKHLKGTAVSSLDEARLGFEEFGAEVHVYAPAYKDDEFESLLSYADHISFNSFSQWRRFKPIISKYKKKKIERGIRINPQHSEVKYPIYDPCSKHSRLGVTAEQFKDEDLDGISGLHFHNLCGLNADALERTLKVLEANFGHYIKQMKWMNFGGGHHITREDYDIDKLCELIIDFKERYQVDIYLEPGEAVALNSGVLAASVLDIIHNEMDVAILDTSAAAHMPDVIEMPYKPKILGASSTGNEHPVTSNKYIYKLTGLTCLAGDVIGDYSFPEPLQVGSKLIFLDMAHYTMVKNNAFNGIRLPSIAICNSKTGQVRVVKEFRHEDYKNRLS
jgi:carboxynorspermidine decarboxylase